jgi:hypothetical protein
MIDILGAVRNVKAARKPFGKDDLRRLYDVCVDISDVTDSTAWTGHINSKIREWGTALRAAERRGIHVPPRLLATGSTTRQSIKIRRSLDCHACGSQGRR